MRRRVIAITLASAGLLAACEQPFTDNGDSKVVDNSVSSEAATKDAASTSSNAASPSDDEQDPDDEQTVLHADFTPLVTRDTDAQRYTGINLSLAWAMAWNDTHIGAVMTGEYSDRGLWRYEDTESGWHITYAVRDKNAFYLLQTKGDESRILGFTASPAQALPAPAGDGAQDTDDTSAEAGTAVSSTTQATDTSTTNPTADDDDPGPSQLKAAPKYTATIVAGAGAPTAQGGTPQAITTYQGTLYYMTTTTIDGEPMVCANTLETPLLACTPGVDVGHVAMTTAGLTMAITTPEGQQQVEEAGLEHCRTLTLLQPQRKEFTHSKIATCVEDGGATDGMTIWTGNQDPDPFTDGYAVGNEMHELYRVDPHKAFLCYERTVFVRNFGNTERLMTLTKANHPVELLPQNVVLPNGSTTYGCTSDGHLMFGTPDGTWHLEGDWYTRDVDIPEIPESRLEAQFRKLSDVTPHPPVL